MIEIVKFERPLVGFRLNGAVVYASVPKELNDSDAKQYAYEQVRSSLEYEQSQESPSIDGSNLESIEVFIPQLPKVKTIKLIGERYVSFDEGEDEKVISFEVEAIDQYGQPTVKEWVWDGASDGVLTVTSTDSIITVSVTADGMVDTLDVRVFPYVTPLPPSPIELSDVEILQQETADLWYEIIVQQGKTATHEQELADLWYVQLTGGM